MSKSQIARRSSCLGSIRKPRSCKASPDATEHEKRQIQVIDSKGLRSISRIVQAIKQRIDSGASGDDAQRSLISDPVGPALISSNCSENNNGEEKR